MSVINGRAKKFDGTAIDYVSIFNWSDGKCISQVKPDLSGNWAYYYYEDIKVGLTYVANGCEPITHGAYDLAGSLDRSDVGVAGSLGFGVGNIEKPITGFTEMVGTKVVGHENYGNYQYSDGSIMCWIPMFYYRWGSPDSPNFAKYGANAVDVKSKYDFADVAAANAAGYAVHRAFYDNGKIKAGFFVDKFMCSNNAGVASSLRNSIAMSSNSNNAPFSALNGSPSNTCAGAINAAKTRGNDFLVSTIFIYRALALLSMAHGQASISADNCAWYDATNSTNYPKGCNNDNLADVNDASVTYAPTGFLKAGKTGAITGFAKTTHNGQSSGVADLNGFMYEIALGLTQLSGQFYALKPSVKVASLTSGSSSANDAWGSASMTANYVSLGATIGELKGLGRTIRFGSGANQVFSNLPSGAEWLASCAGIPMVGGASTTGTSTFGKDYFDDYRANNLTPYVNGSWNRQNDAGVWGIDTYNSNTSSYEYTGFRSALYVD